MTLARPDAKKLERDRERYFASELIDALRGRHPYARVVPVAYQREDLAWDLHTAGDAPPFRVLGRGRLSSWSYGEPTLVVQPRYLEPGTLNAFHIILSEHRFEVARRLLRIKGIACGHEHFWMSRKPVYPINPYGGCPACRLLAATQRVFTWRDEGWNRNVQHVSKEQVLIACAFLGAARIVRLDANENRSLN